MLQNNDGELKKKKVAGLQARQKNKKTIIEEKF